MHLMWPIFGEGLSKGVDPGTFADHRIVPRHRFIDWPGSIFEEIVRRMKCFQELDKRM
jgi:hypothetical protein